LTAPILEKVKTPSMHPLHIAIDGPVAAGKGEIAQRLSRRLGLFHIYTGGLYRALALSCQRHGIDITNAQAVLNQLSRCSIELIQPDASDRYTCRVQLDGADVTDEIFDVAQEASNIAIFPKVRNFFFAKQQLLAQDKSVVMEGRDIGKALPNAYKIFLTANVNERARRRYEQAREKGGNQTFAQVLEETKSRDKQDTTREVDPLVTLPDALVLDTTNMSPDEVVDAIITKLKEQKLIS
jgi:cytidylate kinase